MSSAMESSRRNGDVMQDMNLAEDQIKVLEENFLKVSKQPDEATLMLIAAECGLCQKRTLRSGSNFAIRNGEHQKAYLPCVDLSKINYSLDTNFLLLKC